MAVWNEQRGVGKARIYLFKKAEKKKKSRKLATLLHSGAVTFSAVTFSG